MTTDVYSVDDNMFDITKKKKSRKRIQKDTTPLTDVTSAANNNSVEDTTIHDVSTAENDYSYDYLISRIYDKLPKPDPALNQDCKYQISVPVPELGRVGTQRLSFVNFSSICAAMKRKEKDLQEYFTVELGAPNSIDSHHALVIRGRFQRSHIESVIRSFIRDYVICKTCRSPDTSLEKADRLTMLACNKCHSKYCVASIRAGYRAHVKKKSQET